MARDELGSDLGGLTRPEARSGAARCLRSGTDCVAERSLPPELGHARTHGSRRWVFGGMVSVRQAAVYWSTTA